MQWDRFNAVITEKVGGAYINGGSIRLIPQIVDTSKSSTPQVAQMGAMNMAIFGTMLSVNDEQKPRTIRDVVVLYRKQQVEMLKTMQKSAQDAAIKANEKKTEPNK